MNLKISQPTFNIKFDGVRIKQSDNLLKYITGDFTKFDLREPYAQFVKENPQAEVFPLKPYAFCYQAFEDQNSLILPDTAGVPIKFNIGAIDGSYILDELDTLELNPNCEIIYDQYAVNEFGLYLLRTPAKEVNSRGIYQTEIINLVFSGFGDSVFNTNACISNKELRNLIINGVSKFGSNAFNQCTALETIWIKGANEIGASFIGAGSISGSPTSEPVDFVVDSTEPPKIEVNTFGRLDSTNKMDLTIYVPDNSIADYLAQTNWASVNAKFPLKPISEFPQDKLAQLIEIDDGYSKIF